jgi:PRTRC genetic system ThiF family protein
MFELDETFGRDKPLLVAVVGVGGTGSEMVSALANLHLGLLARGNAGIHVVAFDPDCVSESNIVRQRYAPSDIGYPKATVLINRVNLTYGFDWEAVVDRFRSKHADTTWDLLISSVDTRLARNEIHRYLFRERFSACRFWLDVGNDRTTGQVILGTPRRARCGTRQQPGLPCATELHPELMDVSVKEDAPSCSAAESLARQDLMVNKMVVTLAVDLLWRFLTERRIATHARYFDLEQSALSARRVPGRGATARPGATRASTPKTKAALRRRPRSSRV